MNIASTVARPGPEHKSRLNSIGEPSAGQPTPELLDTFQEVESRMREQGLDTQGFSWKAKRPKPQGMKSSVLRGAATGAKYAAWTVGGTVAGMGGLYGGVAMLLNLSQATYAGHRMLDAPNMMGMLPPPLKGGLMLVGGAIALGAVAGAIYGAADSIPTKDVWEFSKD